MSFFSNFSWSEGGSNSQSLGRQSSTLVYPDCYLYGYSRAADTKTNTQSICTWQINSQATVHHDNTDRWTTRTRQTNTQTAVHRDNITRWRNWPALPVSHMSLCDKIIVDLNRKDLQKYEILNINAIVATWKTRANCCKYSIQAICKIRQFVKCLKIQAICRLPKCVRHFVKCLKMSRHFTKCLTFFTQN